MSAQPDSTQQAMEVVREALKDLNRELQYETLEEVTPDTGIWGAADGIDSLSLVQFAVDLERRIEETFRTRVVLTDERALAVADSPFRTVGSLVAYVADAVRNSAGE